jgi:hypothetical protein
MTGSKKLLFGEAVVALAVALAVLAIPRTDSHVMGLFILVPYITPMLDHVHAPWEVVSLAVFVQFLLYALVLGRAWTKGKLALAVLLLTLFHVAAVVVFWLITVSTMRWTT